MKGKITLLTGGIIGYIAGSKAGRQRFEQIKSLSKRFVKNPTVQAAATEATHKAADAASKVSHAAAAKVGRHDSQDAHVGAAPNGYPTP
ncbi:MAG TPA: hypothetical protein VLI04_01385 [Nocardioidaceae bacterium]|nr:hypothetical protein [Nocardioidaceae bacterium]